MGHSEKKQFVLVTSVLFISLALSACNLANPLAGETATEQDMAGTGEPMGDMEGMAMGSELPPDLDTSSTLMTEQEIYQVSIDSDLDPVAINQIHTWNLHVETPDGQPVENAEITVGGGMPQHDHGFPTSPQVTKDLGTGDYLVEGVKFSMAGWWEMSFDITADGQTDSVTFVESTYILILPFLGHRQGQGVAIMSSGGCDRNGRVAKR